MLLRDMGVKPWTLLLFLCPAVAWAARNYFTAAVFEHRPRSELEPTSNPKDVILSNLKYYERATKFAADQGADIIVFNEYGLFPYGETREVLKTFMEPVPDPEKGTFNPCSGISGDLLILPSFSCMAKRNNIYVVANMGDIQPCEGTCDAEEIKGCSQKCPEDGVLIYNTDVAFNRNGNLIAKYHKMHPYFENLNVPEESEYITFKTEFGTFGMIVCFDSVFDNAIILARDYGIDTLLFPTYWFDDVVPFNAVEWQQSWAIANKVNFIAANTQTPGNGSLGSGIYSKDYGALAYTYEPDGESKIVIANVPIGRLENKSDLKSSIHVIKENDITIKQETGDAFPEHGYYEILGPGEDHYLDYRYFKSQTENYTLVKLEKTSGQVESCNNGFCCTLAYSADGMTEEYYLGSFSGLNNVWGYFHWCEEVCLLIRCDPVGKKSCVMQPSRSKTVFRYVKLSAHFTSDRVYPTVSKNKFRLASKQEWKLGRKGNKDVLEFKSRTEEPLLKAGLFGRCYAQDPPFIPFYSVNAD